LYQSPVCFKIFHTAIYLTHWWYKMQERKEERLFPYFHKKNFNRQIKQLKVYVS